MLFVVFMCVGSGWVDVCVCVSLHDSHSLFFMHMPNFNLSLSLSHTHSLLTLLLSYSLSLSLPLSCTQQAIYEQSEDPGFIQQTLNREDDGIKTLILISQACVEAGVAEAVEENGAAAFAAADRASLPLLMLGGEGASAAAAAAAAPAAAPAEPKGFLRVGMFMHQLAASVTADELVIDILEWSPDAEDAGTELQQLKSQASLDAWVAAQAVELAGSTRVRCIAKLSAISSAKVTRNTDATGGDELRVTLSAPPAVSTTIGAEAAYKAFADGEDDAAAAGVAKMLSNASTIVLKVPNGLAATSGASSRLAKALGTKLSVVAAGADAGAGAEGAGVASVLEEEEDEEEGTEAMNEVEDAPLEDGEEAGEWATDDEDGGWETDEEDK